MKRQKKQTVILSSIVAAMFILPLIVFAAYESGIRDNRFRPAQAKVEVKEGNDTGDALQKDDYTWVEDNDCYYVEKPVAIQDVRGKNKESLRVQFVPMWMDDTGNVCSSLPGLFNYTHIVLTNDAGDALNQRTEQAQATVLCFRDSIDTTLLTLRLADNWHQSWIWNPDDLCFYYKSVLQPGQTTPELLTKAEVPKSVYYAALDNEIKLRLDVLADAVQTTDGAAGKRDPNWNIS